MSPGTVAQLVAATGVVAILVGLMAMNAFAAARDRARAKAASAAAEAAARPAQTTRYLVHQGHVLGIIAEERGGRMLVTSGLDRFVVEASRVQERDGEWILKGAWDADAGRAAAATWS